MVKKAVDPDQALLEKATAAAATVGFVGFHDRKRGGKINWTYMEKRLRVARKLAMRYLKVMDEVLPAVIGKAEESRTGQTSLEQPNKGR